MKKIKSEIRKSYLLNKYVIITPGRAKRPKDVKTTNIVHENDNCPFCQKNLNQKNIVDQINKKGSKKWQVLSINNIFPAVTLSNSKAYGKQEVIIETPEHGVSLANLNLADIEAVLKMYQTRTKEIAKNKKIDYILCFKNQGAKAGASLQHAHSQVFATQIIPEILREEAALGQKYFIKHHACAYCDIIKKEVKSRRRIINNKHIAVFAPYASEYHYEAWLFPQRHLDNITEMTGVEITALAKALKHILNKLQKINLDYNYFLHNVISDTHQHFYIKVQPRDSVWAGVELGSGLVINSVPPETAAKYYRSK